MITPAPQTGPAPERHFALGDSDLTAALAQTIGGHLRPGDVLLLSGPVGAGKTHFARALIQARLATSGQAEDVPSPSFTLVQVYDDGQSEIWHADLYRLGGPDEIAELGLHEAFGQAICLVEWPDRLGQSCPARHLAVSLAIPDPDTPDLRHMSLRAEGAGWGWLAALALPESAQ